MVPIPLPPSTSPEHGPIDEGATFNHAVAREILLDAIAASKVLGVDSKERKEWEQVLANLVPYKIGTLRTAIGMVDRH